MRLPITLAACILLIQLATDFYLYLMARRRWPGKSLPQKLQLGETIFFIVYILVFLLLPKRSDSNTLLTVQMWMLFTYFTVYVPKALLVVADLLSRLPQLWHRPRIKAFTAAGGVLAAVAFLAMWWGALAGRYRTQLQRVEVEVENLPESFEGFTIVQISDLHTGTFGSDTTFVSRLVDSVNALEPDLIVFTGDIVNRRTDELLPHAGPLSRLDARHGVISILGNHDYGDYYDFGSPAEKEQNMEWLMDLQIEMGWELLTNSTAIIYGDLPGDSIAIVGVENWGDPPFHTYGSLADAYPTPADSTVKILLTHNPAHWVAEVAPADSMKIDLTLSGHTHAMQMELGGISPAALRYPTWGGLYHSPDGRRPLYVNIGAGTVGIPMRVGATPEITLITLRNKDSK